MKPLTLSQQYLLVRHASIGMGIFDSLVASGVRPSDAEQLARDQEVLRLHRLGRAEGSAKVRIALSKAAEKGNVSALKTLRLHEELPPEEEPRTIIEAMTPAQREAHAREMMADLARRFEK